MDTQGVRGHRDNNHSSPCHALEAQQLTTAVELTRLAGRITSLEEHRQRLNGEITDLNQQTLDTLREVQALPTEVAQRAHEVAAGLRGELIAQMQHQVGTLRTEWQTAEVVRQEAERVRREAHERELAETRQARLRLYGGIASTLLLAAAAGGPNALEWINQGIRMLLGAKP